MIKPTLTHKPDANYAYEGITVRFASGAPLSADQLNFLHNHEAYLSQHHLDPVSRYYLKPYRQKKEAENSFLLHGHTFTEAGLIHLKRRILALIQASTHGLSLQLKPEEFLQFRAATVNELILYHGNQFLTGAPFHPGGIPYTLYFQWGNLFGVAKYQVLPDEKNIKGNVLIYFEDMQERQLDDCVHHYQLEHRPEPAPRPTPAPAPTFRSPFTIPKLTLARFQADDDKKSK